LTTKKAMGQPRKLCHMMFICLKGSICGNSMKHKHTLVQT